MEVALIIGGIIIFVGLIILLAYWSEKKRREAMQQVAEKLECSFRADGSSFLDELADYFLFGLGHAKRAKNVIASEKPDFDVAIFDYRYTTGSGKNQSTHNQTVVRVRTAGLDLPHFEVRPENFFHKIGGMFGYQDIDFEDYPDFSKRYLLRGDNEEAVREAFSEEVIRFFENIKDICAEGRGDTLLVYRRGRRLKPEQIEEKTKEALQVLGAFVGANSAKI